jgi:hypothetical protein
VVGIYLVLPLLWGHLVVVGHNACALAAHDAQRLGLCTACCEKPVSAVWQISWTQLHGSLVIMVEQCMWFTVVQNMIAVIAWALGNGSVIISQMGLYLCMVQ